MRRIKYACLEQTLHFSQKDIMSVEDATRYARAELDQYKADLERKNVHYKIVSEEVQPDGSIILKVKKQYNAHSYGDYLN